MGELELLLESPDKLLDLSTITQSKKSKRNCPRCRKRMWLAKFPDTDVDVDICPRDGGIWLDKGELITIAQSQTSSKELIKIKDFFGALFTEKTDQKES